VNAGPSSKLGVDNSTGCLLGVLQFCSPVATGENTDLTCPSLAFRRPAAAVPNGTSRVGSRLSHLYAVFCHDCRLLICRKVRLMLLCVFCCLWEYAAAFGNVKLPLGLASCLWEQQNALLLCQWPPVCHPWHSGCCCPAVLDCVLELLSGFCCLVLLWNSAAGTVLDMHSRACLELCDLNILSSNCKQKSSQV